jgi:protein-S-isoprenylcysteine O-methyltransferase Ste14
MKNKLRSLLQACQHFNQKSKTNKRYNITIASIAGALYYLSALTIFAVSGYFVSFISNTSISLVNAPSSLNPLLSLIFKIIGESPLQALWHLYFAFLILSLIKIIFAQKTDLNRNRGYVFWQSLFQFIRKQWPFVKGKSEVNLKNKDENKLILSQYQRTTLLYAGVKFFYLPLMLNFLYGNLGNLFYYSNGYFLNTNLAAADITKMGYLAIIYLIETIDTSIFTFGYTFEFSKRSEVRSVDSTFIGWIVALACYPPFNNITSQVLGWSATGYSTFGSPSITLFWLSLSIIFFVIYVFASIVLGMKASNLTNRGIVSSGPYKYIRHPAYITKNLMWMIMAFPVMNLHMGVINLGHLSVPMIVGNWGALASVLLWMFVYYLRALTEEKHLLVDPDYQAYCQKVRYRFIPGIY